MEKKEVTVFNVFVTHASDVPDDWFDKITLACNKATEGSHLIRFELFGQHYDEKSQRTNQQGFFEEIKKADIYIWLVAVNMGIKS